MSQRQWTSKTTPPLYLILLILATLATRGLSAIQIEQTCYWPDKNIADGYAPCNITAQGTQASASACCPDNSWSYCTESGLCYSNGILSRGGCTDQTWSSPSCPQHCATVVKTKSVNLFNCHHPSLFQCGTGTGPGDCSTNFTLENQLIVLRSDQEPGAKNALNYTDPSATFVNKASIPSSPTIPPSSPANDSNTSTGAWTTYDGPSPVAIGLGLGLPLGFLLLVSLAIIIWQERRLHRFRQEREQAKLSAADLARATHAVGPRRPVPYGWRGGEMAASWRGTEADRGSGGRGGSGDTVLHELHSPVEGTSNGRGMSRV